MKEENILKTIDTLFNTQSEIIEIMAGIVILCANKINSLEPHEKEALLSQSESLLNLSHKRKEVAKNFQGSLSNYQDAIERLKSLNLK